MPAVLLADDDRSIRTVLEQALKRQGYDVMATDNGEQLLTWVREGLGSVAIADVIMPTGRRGETGLDLLPRIRDKRPELPVIIISAQSTLMTAIKANEAGAFDYLPKPFDLEDLIACVNKAARHQSAETPGAANDDSQAAKLAQSAIIGTSASMQQIYRTLARVVPLDLTIMIRGESGTGKELIARALHELGPRKHKPFIAVNMAAIPKELIESELFGHEKGAFTGAIQRKSGSFEQAAGGTIFLDEIGDMPADAQTKLLRVLQQGEFTTVGGSGAIRTDVRVICATHRDLRELVTKGAFREDLFYRLNVVPLYIPPLRERNDDIPALITSFLDKARSRGLPYKVISREALIMMQSHNWPGNVRELENFIYRLCALTAEQVIDEHAVAAQLHMQPSLPGAAAPTPPLETLIAEHLRRYFAKHDGSLPASGIYGRILPLMERPLIIETLRATGGNQLKAAQLLGINRNTLRRKMLDLGITSTSAKG